MAKLLEVSLFHDSTIPGSTVPVRWDFRTKTFRGIKYPDLSNYPIAPNSGCLLVVGKEYSASTSASRVAEMSKALGLPGQLTPVNTQVCLTGHNISELIAKLTIGAPKAIFNAFNCFGMIINGKLSCADPVLLFILERAFARIGVGAPVMYAERKDDVLKVMVVSPSASVPFAFVQSVAPFSHYPISKIIRMLSFTMMNPALASSVYMQALARPASGKEIHSRLGWVDGRIQDNHTLTDYLGVFKRLIPEDEEEANVVEVIVDNKNKDNQDE